MIRGRNAEKAELQRGMELFAKHLLDSEADCKEAARLLLEGHNELP